MRIFAVTDLHGNAEKAEEFSRIIGEEKPDVVLIGGDITNFGTPSRAAYMLSFFTMEEGAVFFVPGNCDPKELLGVEELEDARNVHGRMLSHDGYEILGLGGSNPTPFSTFTELSEVEIEGILRDLKPASNTIILSHLPPYGTKMDRTFWGHHVGSRALRDFVERSEPRLVVVGHIHEGRGRDRIGPSVLLNPGPGYRGFYAIIDIDEHDVGVSLHQL